MDIKKYKLVTIEEMLKLSVELKSKCRVSIAKDKAIVIYDEEVEDGWTNQETVDYLNSNYNDWNEPDLT